jgi:enoyl-CoA hydratase/carnithine racemase
LLGLKRAAYYLYTSDQMDAATARELGLINEVLPREELLPRARAIAEKIMKKPRATRRFTASVVRRPWKRRMLADLGHHMAHEFLAMRLDPIGERR